MRDRLQKIRNIAIFLQHPVYNNDKLRDTLQIFGPHKLLVHDQRECGQTGQSSGGHLFLNRNVKICFFTGCFYYLIITYLLNIFSILPSRTMRGIYSGQPENSPPPLKYFPVFVDFSRLFKLHKGILTCVLSLFSFFFFLPFFPEYGQNIYPCLSTKSIFGV